MPDPTVRDTELDALADVHTVLQLCASGRLRCSEKTARPAAATVRTVGDALASGDFYPDDAIAGFAWPLLVQAGGLVWLTAGKLELTPAGRSALAGDPAAAIRRIWQRWPQRAPIDEFSRVEAIKGQRGTNVLTAAKPRRQAAAAALGLLPDGEWVAVDEVFRLVRRTGDFAVARSERALWKLYIEDPQYGSLGYDGYGNWSVVQGRYLLAVLFEYAAPLGLIDVDYDPADGARDDHRDQWGGEWVEALSRYDGLRAVRRTALGSYACGLTTSYSAPARPAPQRVLEVLPNGDVAVLGGLPDADRIVLDAYSARRGDRVWRVDAATLLAALDTGRSPAALVEFLGARAGHDLPASLHTLVADVTARAARVRDLGTGRVVECADPATAALIARDRTLRAHCTQLGERHLLVPADREDRFRAGLRALGHVLGGR